MDFIHQRITEASEKNKSKEAIRLDNRYITYEQLETGSDQIACVLLEMGISPGDKVGLFIEKSIESIVTILGVLKASAVYVPLDVNSPLKRLDYIISNCGISLLISENKSSKIVKEIIGLREIIKKDACRLHDKSMQLDMLRCDNGSAKLAGASAQSKNTACILFTSGTTGSPKGVEITHNNLTTFVDWVIEEFDINEQDCFSSHAPFHFDISFLDIYASLVSGAQLVLIPYQKSANPKYILNLITTYKITMWQSVPSVLTLMADFIANATMDLSSLRYILFTGEKFSINYLKSLSKTLETTQFINIYGCTETNDTFLYKVPKKFAEDEMPIGNPISYTDYKILDQNGRDVSKGEKGELVISAPTVMTGYFGEKDLNTACFVTLKDNAGESKRYFRTKDLVSEKDGGFLMLHGRVDNIIKSNGYRINLSEIENLILTHNSLKEVGIISIPDPYIGNKIAAVVVTTDSNLSTIDLRIYCSQLMPKYMIPQVIKISTNSLQKTSSGKVDKQGLRKQLAN